MRDSPISLKAQQFTESVIREMTRLAMEHDAINLAQGFPDFPAPAEVKDAAVRAICADVNQYAITWGAREFRRAIAERFRKDTGLEIDPERELTVCCGATSPMRCTNTWSTTASSMAPSPRCPACAGAPSPSTACRRPTA